jgi:hypothetical protein
MELVHLSRLKTPKSPHHPSLAKRLASESLVVTTGRLVYSVPRSDLFVNAICPSNPIRHHAGYPA